MFHGKRFYRHIIIASSLLLTLQSFAAQETKEVQEKETSPRPTQLQWKNFSVGISMWNDPLEVKNNGEAHTGFANYAGVGWGLSRNWQKNQWVKQLSASYFQGKTTSRFKSSQIFPDGINRSWWSVHLAGAYLYRSNPHLMAGLGLLVRHTQAEWESLDETIDVQKRPSPQANGQFILTWQVNSLFSITQIFTPLENSNTMWVWLAQTRF